MAGQRRWSGLDHGRILSGDTIAPMPSGSIPSPLRQAHSSVDDRCVPLRAGELVDVLARDRRTLEGMGHEIRRVAGAIGLVVTQEAASFEEQIDDLYDAFNPESDSLSIGRDTAHGGEAAFQELRRRGEYLLRRANFHKLTGDEMQEAILAGQITGLRVKLDEDRLDMLSVWVRGRAWSSRTARSWKSPFKGRVEPMPLFRRVLVFARLKDDPAIHLKMFREIPLSGLEALLPHARAKMGWTDRMQAFAGAGGVIGSTVWRLSKMGIRFTSIGGRFVLRTQILWMVAFALVLLLFRAVFGFKRAKDKRDTQRTRHLYFQNMSNNAGVIHTLTTMVAQEEQKEVVLAWTLCAAAERGLVDKIQSEDDLRDRVGRYIARRFGVRIRFDAKDACEALGRMGLWADRAAFRVLPASESVAVLMDHYRHQATIDHHFTRLEEDDEQSEAVLRQPDTESPQDKDGSDKSPAPGDAPLPQPAGTQGRPRTPFKPARTEVREC